MQAGRLDRIVQVRRASYATGTLGQEVTWADVGSPLPASRQDVRDSERLAAGQVTAATMTHFVVRWSAFAASITPADRLACDGREWSITGIKEIGRRKGLEITAVAEFA